MNNLNDPIAIFLGHWSMGVNTYSILLRILLSVLLSAIVGWERANKRHAAGMRTFIIVSLATTSAMILDYCLFCTAGSNTFLISASSLIAIAIISVNSVLFSSRNQIKGLTTSVGLWACGIIGLSLGAGYYTITLIAFFTLLCGLSLFPALELYLKNRSNHFEVHLELTNSFYLKNFVSTIRKLGLTIDDIELNPAYGNSGLSVYSIAITICKEELKKYKTHQEIIEALSTLDYIYHIEEMPL